MAPSCLRLIGPPFRKGGPLGEQAAVGLAWLVFTEAPAAATLLGGAIVLAPVVGDVAPPRPPMVVRQPP
ncbi:hypothetical protein [Enhydrobacter sp.]|uniref:hypothetical protein n=1 Tax=Enhydrobacter sp. TaxID=1894999 RepID=UPI0026043E78|nr:hypothetical protein [Enhydrobacter sp.]WIM12610.1 MAG: hypothetical protein OJF58_003572 [Enhydrobacter sp.]